MDKYMEMVKALITNNEFVVIDIETTTFSPLKGGRIIEIGLAIIKDDKIVKEYDYLINPEQKIPKKITQLTGITDEMVKDKAVIGKVLPYLYNNIIKNRVVVCHNADFDWNRFLQFYLEKVGINADNFVIDVMILAKKLFPHKKKFSLVELANELNIEYRNAHRASNDAKITALILLEFKKMIISNINNLDMQISMIEPKTNYYREKEKIKRDEIKIYKIQYWEKPITKKKRYQRIYVTCNIGSVYFDIPSQIWYVKELRDNFADKNLDLNDIEALVLEKLNYKSRENLLAFRN